MGNFTPALTPEAAADSSTLNGIIAGALKRNGAAWARYNQVVEEAGEGWLEPAQLASTEGRERARATSIDLRTGAGDLGGSVRSSMRSALAQLRPLADRNLDYRPALRAAEESAARTEVLLGEYLAAQHALLDRFDQIVAHTSTTQPDLDPTGAYLLFETERDAERYNVLIAGLDALVSAENRAITQLQEREQDFLRKADSLRGLLGGS